MDNWLVYSDIDIGEDNVRTAFTQMVRISGMYDTDALLDKIFEDQLESALSNIDMDDPAY